MDQDRDMERSLSAFGEVYRNASEGQEIGGQEGLRLMRAAHFGIGRMAFEIEALQMRAKHAAEESAAMTKWAKELRAWVEEGIARLEAELAADKPQPTPAPPDAP